MSKTFAIGDIHGRSEALKEVFEKSKFDYENDTLIVLGDIVDGGYNTYEVIEELLKIKNVIFVIGNHDCFLMDHLKSGWSHEHWLCQGGVNTLNSYGGKCKAPSYRDYKQFGITAEIDLSNVKIPQAHINFLNNGVYYYEYDNMLFVHAGINPNIQNIKDQQKEDLTWDRNLIEWCKAGNTVPGYDKVFVGHTTTQNIDYDCMHTIYCNDCNTEWNNWPNKCPKCKSENIGHTQGCLDPLKYKNLVCLDTGAGWTGKLTIMDVHTEEYWQSKIQTPAQKYEIKTNYPESMETWL